jgi:hypothetical protein
MESKHLLISPISRGAPTTVAGTAMNMQDVTIEFHRNAIPAFVEAELDRLYGSLFCSLAHFRVYGGAENASTYIARSGGKTVAIFLFRIEGSIARVINEWMPVDDAEASRFAASLFANYPSVGAVVFGAVTASISRPAFPYQRADVTEDSVLTLPDSDEEFLARLGKSMRNNIRYYLNKLKRERPSFRFAVYRGSEADEGDMREIVRLNRIRMQNKNKVSANDDAALEKILQLARATGLVGVVTVDGRLCAGVIGYRIGDHFFSWVRSHNPAFDDYRLGRLTAYLMIGAAIASGIREYHFMWGREEHKAMLQGVERRFERIVLYRSRLHMLRHAGIVLNTARIAWTRRLRLWLQDAQQHDDHKSHLAVQALKAARHLKQALTHRRA